MLPTFRGACYELNLLESDTYWDLTITEAALSASPSQIRTLFAIIISTCFPSNPNELWDTFKDYMLEDILHLVHVHSRKPDLGVNNSNRALIMI